MESELVLPPPEHTADGIDFCTVVEIGSIGAVATIAAYVLGLSGLDMLLAVFFSTTLAGQFLTAFLNRIRPA